MPESQELDALDLATEQQLLALLELPPAPPALDARVLAAARAAADALPAADAPPPRGILLRFPFQQAAAAAAVLIAAALTASLTAPSDELLGGAPTGEEPFVVGAVAQVLQAEGAFGASAQPMLVGAPVAQGEPLAVQPGGFLRLRLECGTELVLDGGTTGALRFDPGARRLRLDRGRLYAKVVKVGTFVGRFGRENRPLVVETPGGRARVLGTELTVRAVDSRARVTVRTGTVRLENDHGHSLVSARQSGLLVTDAPPTTRQLGSVDRQFRWIGKIQAGQRHPAEKPFGGVAGDGEPAIGTLVARLSSGEAARLALAEQSVDTQVRDGQALTTISFLFRNPTAQQLEGTFRFALPKDANIRRYAVETHGELREGRVIEREAARAIYQEQKARMQAPALLEWSRGSAFTAKVFPIEPNATKRIVIAFEQVLPERDGVSRLLLPLVSEAASAHPPERLTVDVRLSGPEGGAALRCPSHNVRVFREGADLVLRMEAQGLTPRNDFILEMSRPAAPIVEGRFEEGPDGEPASVLVRVRPDLSWAAERLAHGPLVVLCDGSASQAGTLKEVQLEALEALMEAVGDARSRAFVYHVGLDELPCGSADAVLGGLWRARTEGAADLALALRGLADRLPPDGGATLVYLGDGNSTAGQRDDEQVLRALRRSLPPATVRRVVTVGIGADVNQSLLTRIARERSGVYVGVRPGDHLGRKLDEVVSAAREPVLTQIQARIEVPGIHEVAPQRPANLRVGEVLDLSARLSGDARRGWLILSGLLGGEVFEARAPLWLEPTPKGDRLADLWARRRIDDLLEQGPASKDEVTDLALYHGLVSPHTSLLVVSDEEYARAQERRAAAQQGATEALLKQTLEALTAERFDQAQRLALRFRRRTPTGDAGLQLLAKVAQRRAAAAETTDRELIELPGEVNPVALDPTDAETSLGGDEWFAARASLGLPPVEPSSGFYDVNGLVRRAPDYPAPELGLDLTERDGGGGGAGGVLSFDDEGERAPYFGRSVVGGRVVNEGKLSKEPAPVEDSRKDLYENALARKEIAEGQVARLENLEKELKKDVEELRKLHEQRAKVKGLELSSKSATRAVPGKTVWKRDEKLGEERGEERDERSIDLPRTREKALTQSAPIDRSAFNRARRAAITERRPEGGKASIGGLKSIGTSQSLFREGDKEGDGNLDYGTLEGLSETGLIDSVLGSGTKNGYLFKANKGAEDMSFAWNARANPALPGTTDRRYTLDSYFSIGGAQAPRGPFNLNAARGEDMLTLYSGEALEGTGYQLIVPGKGLFTDVEVNQTGTIPVLNPVLLRQLSQTLNAASPTERPSVFEQTLQTVRSYRSAGVTSALVPLLRDMLRYAPRRAELHELLGGCLQGMGRPRAALRAYSGLVEAKPDDAEAHWRFASALLRLELPRRALVEAREAARLRPDVARYRLGLAALALRQGRPSEAEGALRAVLARNFHPEQGDVASQARAMLQALWAETLRKAPERLTRNLQALRSGAVESRPVRVVFELTSGQGRLVVDAPGENPVSEDVPFTAAGGRLVRSESGASYSHSGPSAGQWTIRVTAGAQRAAGRLRVLAGERSWEIPVDVEPNQTSTVFTQQLTR